jgi:type VI secretion system protein ImpE
LRDGDDLLAPVIELVAGGRYVWLGLHQIKTLTAKEPRVLLDTCWIKVDLVLTTGQECPGVIPVLYSGSHESGDGALQLGHATDWQERNGLMRGVGRRMLYANGEEIDLLAVREITTGD